MNFTDSSDFQWTSNTTDISAEFYTAIKFGTTGTINVICYWDDYWTLYLDNTQRTFWYSNTEQQRTFSFDARADTYYWDSKLKKICNKHKIKFNFNILHEEIN